MNLCQQPLRFEPYFRPLVWGGRRIGRYLGKNLPTQELHGESWEVSDHKLHQSRLATASGYGVTLRHLMEGDAHDLLGSAQNRYRVFPWLIKLLDVQDWLSVQVHPDEDAVKKLCPGEWAKSEAWCILEADPQSRIYAGLKPGVGPTELRQAIEQGTVTECLHGFTPRAGDLVYLPAGTVHAIGGGVLLAEIQQSSDVTFRLFDWNRKSKDGQTRPLHVAEALACIHWDQPVVKAQRSPVRDQPSDSRPLISEVLVACPYFAIEEIRVVSSISLGGVGSLQALIVAEGHGRFSNGEFLMPGDAWVLPAAMPQMELHVDRPVTGLLCKLPE